MNTSHIVVTAYYPIQVAKHNKTSYKQWYTNFFNCVSSKIICFCPTELEDEFRSLIKTNVRLVVREFNSFEMMSAEQTDEWKEWHTIDPEKHIHSPELYAIWAAKQEFIQEAIKIEKSSIYTWCDIGSFRNIRPGNFEYTYKYIQPSKITCISIVNLIGGGILSGDKDAWDIFSRNYLTELKNNVHGKDQVIYRRILNDINAVIIEPNNKYGDPWFYLTYIFSMDI